MADRAFPEGLIWATRGRSWGFRFLLDGGLSDPLPEYERVFTDLDDEPTAWRQMGEDGALRFLDPQGRRDASGRVIPHEFVVPRGLSDAIESAEDGLREVWPLVAEAYANVWDAERPPSAAELFDAPVRRDPTPGGTERRAGRGLHNSS